LPTAALASVAAGATAMVLLNASVVNLQLGAAPVMRGRVMAIFGMVFTGSHALGSPLSGWIAERFGVRSAIGVGAAGALAVGLIARIALHARHPRRPRLDRSERSLVRGQGAEHGDEATAAAPDLGTVLNQSLSRASSSTDFGYPVRN
jgi:MFS family permease